MRSIYEVARREYLAYVTAWGFWLGLILTPVGLLVGVVLPGMIEGSQPVRYYTVLDRGDEFSRALARQIEGWRADEARIALAGSLAAASTADRDAAMDRFAAARVAGLDALTAVARAAAPTAVKAPPRRYLEVAPPAASLDGLRPWLTGDSLLSGPDGDKPLFAALVVSRDAAGAVSEIAYWSEDVVAGEIPSAASSALRTLARAAILERAGLDPAVIERADLDLPSVVERKLGETGETSEVSNADRAPFFVASAMSFMLWLLIFSIVNFLIMGTIEERSNKIFDTLLTSVRLTHLLAGKLIGVFALCATLMGAWAIIAGAMLLRSADPALVSLVAAAVRPELLLAAGAGFLAGYVMYAALFLALGSLCDTIQEAQTLMSPLIIFLMVPLFVVVIAIRTPDSPIVEALAWFPPFTPFLMILRAPLEPPLWQMLAQVALMGGFAALALFASVRVYRAGAVNGASVSQAWAWIGRKRAER